MKRFANLQSLCLLVGCVQACGLALAQVPTPSGYQLAWSDDFDGATLNTNRWTPANTNVPTNNSRQDYLPQQVAVGNGNLVITSENLPSRGLPYRSGLVTSTAVQKYGRWEVRAKLPTSTGMWPAIWLLPDALWPSQGEIDIMENRGNEPTKTSSAFHYGTNPPYQHSFRYSEHTRVHNEQLINFHSGFHIYAMEWDPQQIRFYVDDVHFWTLRNPSVNGFLSNSIGPMRLIINTAIGGDFLPNPDASTVWPQRFEVDFVRVYTRLESGPTLSFENGGFEANGGSMGHWTTFGNIINNVSTSSSYVMEGDSSLKLYGQFNGQTNFSGVEQGLSVLPGQELMATARAWIPSNDSIAGSGNRVELKIDYYRQLYGLFGSSEYISSDWVVLADGNSPNNVWLSRDLISTVPANAVEARVALVFRQQANAAGAVFVDDVQFGTTQMPASVVASYIYHGGWTGAVNPQWSALDSAKHPAKEGELPRVLDFSHLINSSQGINGLVFDIENLPGQISAEDLLIQVSPQGEFNQADYPPLGWDTAPVPSLVTTLAGATSRVLVQWPNGAIINRWLRLTLQANSNTGLAAPEVYYVGHLLGETSEPENGFFTVSFSDVSAIRGAIGQNVDSSNILDIDKSGLVSFSDIQAMREYVGTRLPQITVEASQ